MFFEPLLDPNLIPKVLRNIWKDRIFQFVTKLHAKRSSANRVAETLETKPMTSIGRDIRRSFLINKVLHAILDK